MTGNDKVDWMEGNFFLLIHSHFNSSMGSGLELGVMGYDSTKNVYTYSSYNSIGEHDAATGTFQGDTWTWNSDPGSAPGNTRWRYTQKIISPTTYTIKFEMQPEGGTWSTVMEGKATKQ